MIKPYKEIISIENILHRTFPADTPSEQLVWHRDQSDRWVTIVESEGWQLQIDNELPIILEENKTYYIEKGRFHRVIKGNGLLKVSIKEK